MRKIVAAILLCGLALTANAVPARRGWQTRTQADGTSIEVQQMGDEFYHFWITKDGKVAEMQEDGSFIVTNQQQPSGEQVMALRKASKRYVNRAKKIGANSMPARGLFILVNFSDQSFSSASESYYKSSLGDNTEGAKSMYNYLKLQSNGKYAPPIDVFGPVTLSKTVSYYGSNDSQGNDKHPAEMVVEACKALDSQIDFSQYDANSDGKVDNVYVIYAGKGEADGGAKTTIWPHQWSIDGEGLSCKLDGKNIYTYACSSELSGEGIYAMGTPLHEFSHVLGLPDYYDTEYESTNYTEGRTPGDWSLMDAGSYNDNGNTPPNYSIFDKYYLGWDTPKLLAKNDQLTVTLTTEYGDAYQVNGGTTLLDATNTKTIYYIENRQQTGWDAALPGHGMIVWRVMYDESEWENNELNNYSGTTRYTVLSASGDQTDIGKSSDPFPGTKSVKTWTPFTGCAFTEITESNGTITFKYNGGQTKTECTYELLGEHCTIPADGKVAINAALSLTITPDEGYTLDDASCWTVEMGKGNELVYGQGFTYNASTNEFRIAKVTDDVTILVEGKQQFQLTWMSNGVEYTKTTSAGTVVTPEAPEACEGKVFAGWCDQSEYQSESVAPAFVKTGDAVTEAKTFYAVFATEEAGSGASMEKASAIAVGDEVVLVYETGKMELSSFGGTSTVYGVGTAYTEAPTGEFSFEVVTGSENGTYAFVRDGKYWAWTSGNSLKTATTLDENSSWNVSFEGGDAIIANAAEQTRTILWNASSPRFACYTTGQKAVQLYKKGTGVSYSDYTTTCTKPEPVYYTIRFFDNGEQIGESQSVLKGEQAEAPADPKPACEAYTFAGWWTEALEADNTDAKEWITDFKATGDQDYYAVFSKTVSGEGLITEFVKANAITIGDEVALVYEATKMELSSFSNSKTPYGEGTAYTEAPKGVYSLSVVAGSENGTYAFVRDKAYLAWTSGNSLDTINTLDANSSWNVSFDNGDAILTSAADETRKLQWNGSNPRFACYTSAQKAVQLYKKTSTSGSLTYYTTTEVCTPTAIEQTNAKAPVAVKAIRNGQMVIIRGNEVFSVSGAKLN